MKATVIGPMIKPITGVTVSNDLVVRKLIEIGWEVIVVNTSPKKFQEDVGVFTLLKLVNYLKIWKYFYKIFYSDVVYITPGQSFLGVLKYFPFLFCCRLFKKECIVHLHGNVLWDNYLELNKLKKVIFKFSMGSATQGIVLSESLKYHLEPFICKNKIHVLSNFVENEYILSANDLANKNYKNIRIVYLSNLMVEKGIFIFLNALEKLNEIGVDYKCRIAGSIDNSNKHSLMALMDNNDRISYEGIVNGKRKYELLKWGNVFVFPSKQKEGLPISILESMASGNRVVTTSHPAIQDLFSNEDLDFIETNSVVSLADAIHGLEINMESIWKNHARIISEFSEEKFIDKLDKILKHNGTATK